jgi:hypothetical protein
MARLLLCAIYPEMKREPVMEEEMKKILKEKKKLNARSMVEGQTNYG